MQEGNVERRDGADLAGLRGQPGLGAGDVAAFIFTEYAAKDVRPRVLDALVDDQEFDLGFLAATSGMMSPNSKPSTTMISAPSRTAASISCLRVVGSLGS